MYIAGILLIALLILVGIIFFLFKRKKKNQVFGYIERLDKTAQENYLKNKFPSKRLSLKELTEISWKFLYEITNIVLKRFSREDQEILTKIGTNLYKQGMRYQHYVEKNNFTEVEVSRQQNLSPSQKVSGRKV